MNKAMLSIAGTFLDGAYWMLMAWLLVIHPTWQLAALLFAAAVVVAIAAICFDFAREWRRTDGFRRP